MAVFTTCRPRSSLHPTFHFSYFLYAERPWGHSHRPGGPRIVPGSRADICAQYPGSPTFRQVMGASPSYSTMIGNVWTSTKSQDTSVLAFTGSLHETVSPKRSTAYGSPLFIVVVFPLIIVVAYDLHAGYVCQALAATNTRPTCSLWRAHHVRWQP